MTLLGENAGWVRGSIKTASTKHRYTRSIRASDSACLTDRDERMDTTRQKPDGNCKSRGPFPLWVTRRGSRESHHVVSIRRLLVLSLQTLDRYERRSNRRHARQPAVEGPSAEGRTHTANTRTGIVGPVARRQSPLARAERARAARCGYWVARLSAGGLELSLPPPLPDRPSLPLASTDAGPRFLAFRESVALNSFEQRLPRPPGLTTPAARQKSRCASSLPGSTPKNATPFEPPAIDVANSQKS
ncbi:hypothetical protein HPB50_002756 [Hyalomma asiaticum]|uniref:Uncharacterized protein n=1 Tax=Hyalomma asiaticum TaxID=266040 RepID=A0ACB7TDP8_HYAAI|nr:hypothetical protein HPB50_002756 [Hyalomma asiaticum]